MSNLQTHYRLKLDFQKVVQHTEGKWLIHGSKHGKTISCKTGNSRVANPNGEEAVGKLADARVTNIFQC